MLQKLTFSIMIILSIFLTGCNQNDTYIPAKGIYDEMNILSVSDKRHIQESQISLQKKGYDIVVYLIKETPNHDINTFAFQTYNKLKIGKDSKGFLLVLSLDEKKSRLEIGGQSSTVINELIAPEILKTGNNFFVKNEFSQGIVEIIKNINLKLGD